MVFICNCTCRTFFIHDTGEIECANCGTFHTCHTESIGEFVKSLPPSDPTTEKTDGGSMTVTNTGAVFSARATMDVLTKWHREDNVRFIAGYAKNGAGKHWLNITTEDEKAQVVRLLSDLLEFTKAAKIG